MSVKVEFAILYSYIINMKLEKFTEKSRDIIQEAQNYALSEGHQQFTAEHILQELLDNSEGLAKRLIQETGGDYAAVQSGLKLALTKLPKVTGGGAGGLPLRPLLPPCPCPCGPKGLSRRHPGPAGS